MCIISYYKYYFKKEYLYPTDFKLVGEAVNVVSHLDITVRFHILWSCLLILWLAMILLKMDKSKIKIEKRVFWLSYTA
ncbi:TPA: hypothetical protein ACG3Q6_002833 [Clostridioides difficile]